MPTHDCVRRAPRRARDRAVSRRVLSSAVLAVLAAATVLTLLPAPAAAQYFGRNKVQYDRFDFRVLRTSHFDIHFYPEEAEAVRDAARMAERWYERLSPTLDHEFGRRPVVLYANHPDFQQTNVVTGFIGEGTGGITEGLRSRLIMPFTGLYSTFDHVLGHELVHVFQYDIAGGGPAGIQGLSRLPLWVIEGMAEYLSVGRVDAHTAMWLRDALRRDDLPTTEQLTRDPRFFPYRFGQAFWAYVGGTYGDERVNELFRAALQVGLNQAMVQILGVTHDTLSSAWHEQIRRDYEQALVGRAAPAELGRRILARDIDAGEMNISPVLSPDGRHVIFLSELDLFSIDLFLADAESGRVIRKVASSASDGHIDALSFIESAGTWSPDGERFAFVVIAQGDNQLAIADVSGGIQRRIAVPGVDGMRNPSWSPDGRQIVVTGIVGGISDLYVVDVATGSARQLTDDKYADVHPTWSPDGRTIAFATDRGPATDLETLAFGPLRLALVDAEGGAVRTLDVFEGAKHIDPEFSPDGGSLYFVSDREGFSDIYRLDLESREVFQVTRVATGVSGIAPEGPALTIASQTGRMMFSVFEEGNYAVHRLDPADVVETRVAPGPEELTVARLLPPVEAHGRGRVASYLADPETGLPPAETAQAAQLAAGVQEGGWSVREYDPDLRLLYLGTPQVGVATNEYGTSLGGAVSGYFGDILGNRELYVALAANGSMKDVGGQAVYFNREGRWNWGGAASHIPYLSLSPVRVQRGGSPVAPGQIQVGDTVTLVQNRQRVFVDQLQGMGQYPFTTTRRFEVQGGYTRYGFDLEQHRQRILVQPGGNILLNERTEPVELGEQFDPLHLGEVSAAMVGDNSFFGFTSPVSGQRYRYQAGGTFGTVSYGQLLGDWRRYLFRNPWTLAMRGYHFGRYGGDADSERLQPLFVGYPHLIRGYDINSFELSECTAAPGTRFNCAELDRLVGSKMAVANLELRFPLFGVERFGLITTGFLPVELGAFFDAAMAWTGDDSPVFELSRSSPERIPVFSTGATARVNLMGYMVVEVYYAYPFQRPEKGWHFGFNLAPGW